MGNFALMVIGSALFIGGILWAMERAIGGVWAVLGICALRIFSGSQRRRLAEEKREADRRAAQIDRGLDALELYVAKPTPWSLPPGVRPGDAPAGQPDRELAKLWRQMTRETLEKPRRGRRIA